MPSLKLAYHLGNAPFVACLARTAASLGIAHVDATLADVELSQERDRVASLRTTDGRRLGFDLNVDAIGFRSFLLGGARLPLRRLRGSSPL